ncbi:MAG: hybrid sensor histidine kinase/response regulator, partial [Bdellovibrionales bacterium]|nr:hybrid sensor histidine kinase/response regulator [Bdellovibrionales bacterium]
MKYEILLVDDEIDNVDALERLFRKSYTVHKATSGKQALEILRQNPHIALILSDQRMPEMTGVELLKKSIKTHPDTLRILLTGYTDIESIVSSINKGEVYRYLNKPWDPVDLKNTIDKAIEKFKLRQELVEKNQKLQVALNELKSLDQAKTNFMILINHELKTPLTVMTSFLDLLKESSLDEEQSMFVDRIDKSRQRLQNMINATLELVSAETGQMKVNKKSVSTQKLASEIEHQFLQLNNKQQLTFVSQVEDSKVKIDSELIKSVVYKLLENAVKFAHKESQ